MASQFEVKAEPEGDYEEDYAEDCIETDDGFILSSVEEEHLQHMVDIKEEAIEDTDDDDITERSDEEDPLGDPLVTDNEELDNEENTEELNSCEICCKTFTSKTRMIKHLSNVHKKFIDEETRKTMLEESKVNRRSNQKPTSQDYKCNVCEKIFKRSDHRKRHMKIHAKSFNFPQRMIAPKPFFTLMPKSSNEPTPTTKPVLLITDREIVKPNLMISNVIKCSSSNSVILKQREDVKPKQQRQPLTLTTPSIESNLVNKSNLMNIILSRQNDVNPNITIKQPTVSINSNVILKPDVVTTSSDVVLKPVITGNVQPNAVLKQDVTSNSNVVLKSFNSLKILSNSTISSLKLKPTASLVDSSQVSTKESSIKSVSAVTLTATNNKSADSLAANEGKQQLVITSTTVLKPKNTEPKKVFLVEKQSLSASSLIPASSKPYENQSNANVNFLKRKRSEDETPSDFSSTKTNLEANDNFTVANIKKEHTDDAAKAIENTTMNNTTIKKEIIDNPTNDLADIKMESIDDIAVPSIKQEAIEEDDLVQPLNCLEVTMDEKDTDKAIISPSTTTRFSTRIIDKPIKIIKDNMEAMDQNRTRNTLLCRLCDGGVRIPVSNVLVHTTTVHMNPNKNGKYSCPYCPMEFDAYESSPGTRVGCYLLTHVRSKHRLNACGFCGVRMPKQGLHRCKQMEGGDNKMHYVRQSKKVESEAKVKFIPKKDLRKKKKIKITDVEEIIYEDDTINITDAEFIDKPEPIDILDRDIYKISKQQISLENMENHLLKCKFCNCNLQNSHVRQHYEMRHFAMFSRMNKHFCPHCDFETEIVQALWSHFTTIHTKREKCDNCNVRFTNLASHYEKCIGLAQMKACNMCGKALKNLSNHSCPFDRTTKANQPIECNKCGNVMKEKYLRIHQKNHCVGGNSSSFSNFRTERQLPMQPPKFES